MVSVCSFYRHVVALFYCGEFCRSEVKNLQLRLHAHVSAQLLHLRLPVALLLLTMQCTLSLNSQKRHGKLLLSVRRIGRRSKTRLVAAERGFRPELFLRPLAKVSGWCRGDVRRSAKSPERRGT